MDSKYHNATQTNIIYLATALGATPQEEVGGLPLKELIVEKDERVCSRGVTVCVCVCVNVRACACACLRSPLLLN